MKKKFRVGIVGAGHIAKTFHLPAWKKNKKTKIVAICDIDNKRLKKISKKFKVKNTYNNLEKMLKKEKLDILNICTPPNMHFQHIFLGSKYKANMLVEKPFVLNKITMQRSANFGSLVPLFIRKANIGLVGQVILNGWVASK